MNSTCRLASVGVVALGLTALGLVGATAAQASGLPTVGADDYYSVAQGGTLTIAAPGILANDVDAEGDAFYVGNAFSYVGADAVTVNFDGSFQFTPSPSFYGTASFAYYPSDGVFGAETHVYITVTPTVPTAPVVLVAGNDQYTTQQDTPLSVPASAGLLANDSGPGLVYAANGQPVQSGQIVIAADGGFVYTPPAGFVGTTTFGYRTSDGNTFSNDALVTLVVTAAPGNPPVDPPVVVAPIANPDQYTTAQDTPLVIPAASGMLANDSFPAGAVVDIDDMSGEIVAQLDGSFVYTPAAGFSGVKEFGYRMSDGTTLSTWASVSIVVTPAPPAGGGSDVPPPVVTPADPAATPATPAVEAASGAGTLPTLAYTGSSAPSSVLLAPALGFVALGGLGLWAARRRDQHSL